MEQWWPLPVVGVLLGFTGVAVSQTVEVVRAVVRQRRLDRHGTAATAQVVAIDPFGHERHAPAGRPVRLELVDGPGAGGVIRDPDGLSGFLVREGTRVTVHYRREYPETGRVRLVHGHSGPYRPYRGSLARKALSESFLPAAALAVVTAVTLGITGAVPLRPLLVSVPVALLAGGLALLANAVTKAVRHMVRSRRAQRAVRVVTESWRIPRNSAARPGVLRPGLPAPVPGTRGRLGTLGGLHRADRPRWDVDVHRAGDDVLPP